MRIDPAAVISDLDELARQSGGRFAGAKRLAWTEQWLAARDWLRKKLDAAGLESSVDAAGNVWAGVGGGSDAFIVVGSHIDAVPDGGWLDGALGTLAALEVLRRLRESGTTPAVGVRFVCWADEEGARFGRSLIGSSACMGTLPAGEVGSLKDADGVTLEDALASCGVHLESIADAAGGLEGARAYLELHIEQGPVLREAGELACAVSGTFGTEKHLIIFEGQAAHAGSTPMLMRRDSLLAASRAALAVRESAIRHGGVGTVGRMAATPGIITAVAGRTEMLLDQRHLDAEKLALMWAEARASCEAAAQEFGCTVEVRDVVSVPPTLFDKELVGAARAAIRDAGGSDLEPMPSGPLHDASEVGVAIPTVMIFAQSDPPLSHAPTEDSPPRALEVAIDAYGRTVAWAIDHVSDAVVGR